MIMASGVNYLFESGPLPLRAIAWILFGGLAWLMVAFPARWVAAALDDAASSTSHLLSRAYARVFSWRSERLRLLAERSVKLLGGASVLRADEGSGVVHSALAEPIYKLFEAAKLLVSDSRHTLNAYRGEMASVSADLRLSSAELKNGLQSSHFDDLFRHRSSLSRFIGSAVLLVVILPLNAVMLSQILTETGLLPPRLAGFPFPPSYPVAVVLTILEASLGWVYHANALRSPSERHLPSRFSFASAGLILAIIGVACVEGWFYGQVAGDGDLQRKYVFTLWGVLIVVVLCSLAATATAAWFDRIDRSFLRELKSDLSRMSKSFDGLDQQYARAQKQSDDFAVLVESCRKVLGLSDDGPVIIAALDALKKDISVSAGQGSRQATASASGSHLAILSRHAFFLSLLGATWTGLAVATATALRSPRPELPYGVGLLVGIGVGLLCFMIGLVARPRVVYLRDTSQGLRNLTSGANWQVAVGLGAFALLVLLALSLVFGADRLSVLMLSILCLGVALLAQELGPNIEVFPVVVGGGLLRFVCLGAYAFLAAAYLVHFVLVLLKWAANLLAQPSFQVSAGRSYK